MVKLKIGTAAFRSLVGAVTRFPSVGDFGDSGLVWMTASNERLTACAVGIVYSHVVEPCSEAQMPVMGVDRRVLESFVGLCRASSVSITWTDTTVKFRSGKQDVSTAYKSRDALPVANRAETQPIKVTGALADVTRYLSDVAFADNSRPELCCVMLTGDGNAIAANQKVLGVFQVPKLSADHVAVPLALAKVLQEGDGLSLGTKDVTLMRGTASYSMSRPLKAQKEFPIDKIVSYGQQKRTKIAVCVGSQLAGKLEDCSTCLSALSKLEVIGEIAITGGELVVAGSNGQTRFHASMKTLSSEGDATFRIPMTEIKHALPFMQQNVTLSSGEHGDLLMGLPNGWILFPAWKETKT